MPDNHGSPIRERLRQCVEALAAFRSISYLATRELAAAPGSTLTADYATVLVEFEQEAARAIGAAAAEVRKPTVGELVNRIWSTGPLTLREIQATVVEAGASEGDIETLLNRLQNAGLIQTSTAPTTDSAPMEQADTMPPTRLLPNGELPEVTRRMVPPTAPADGGGDVTRGHLLLVTGQGREAFDARAAAHGIDLAERINCQF